MWYIGLGKGNYKRSATQNTLKINTLNKNTKYRNVRNQTFCSIPGIFRQSAVPVMQSGRTIDKQICCHHKKAMPEGPSIVLLKEAAKHLKHKTILEASGYGNLDMDKLSGRKITDIRSWGKHFLICCSDFTLKIHFGLFGSYTINEKKKINPKLALHFGNEDLNFYVCTAKLIEQPLDEIYDWESDVMSEHWNPDKALKKIEAKPTAMICDLLLDQNIFAGVGNIIKNEVLYRCKVHPESIISYIPKTRLKSIISEARKYSFDFLKWKRNKELSRHFEVYEQKTGKTNGGTVTRKDTGKTRRHSYFIEKIQKRYS